MMLRGIGLETEVSLCGTREVAASCHQGWTCSLEIWGLDQWIPSNVLKQSLQQETWGPAGRGCKWSLTRTT